MKVIDLLNKIANGEEVPNRIKVNRSNYRYVPDIDYINEDDNYLMDIIALNSNELNTEVEIIEEKEICHKCGKYPAEYNQTYCEFCLGISEEDKKIEKIDVNHLQQIKKWKRAKILGNKINEIIDYLKEKE